MDISNEGSIVTINGNIKSISDYEKIKNNLSNLAVSESLLSINIIDSISITSSVIGYFTKLIYKDKVKLSINVGDERLAELLDELHLTSLFDVKKI